VARAVVLASRNDRNLENIRGDIRAVSYLFYMSCFGTVEQTDGMSRKNARAVAAYLRDHPVAYPLYIVNVKVTGQWRERS
jgi:hypothetical protein